MFKIWGQPIWPPSYCHYWEICIIWQSRHHDIAFWAIQIQIQIHIQIQIQTQRFSSGSVQEIKPFNWEFWGRQQIVIFSDTNVSHFRSLGSLPVQGKGTKWMIPLNVSKELLVSFDQSQSDVRMYYTVLLC